MSGTLVCFHAHPDDEAIATGGVIAQAAASGRRVVLVLATRGERGEVPDGFLDPGETLTDRRVDETMRAAQVLGIARIEFLGYHDSGMAGLPENDALGSFWSADVAEAAERLAAILRDEDAQVLVVYDENGGYGHPDHIQVHRVGVRAAELAATPRVYETTMNRDAITRMMRERADDLASSGIELPDEVTDPEDIKIGVPEEMITTTVDVREFADVKRAALAEHASQVSDAHFFLAMPPELFREAFGMEWFIRRDVPPDLKESSLFDGVG
jgi:LmbE family N-acetylglucosaminyl deacetylase